jgi:hypothetical protein
MTETLTALDGTPHAVEERLLAPSSKKWVYEFAEGSRQMRNLLGGKGAGIAEMTRILGPKRVAAAQAAIAAPRNS